MRIPTVMVLDREPDYQGDVLNIDYIDSGIIIVALEDVCISLLDGEFPSGTLRFKAGQSIVLPLLEELNLEEEYDEDQNG